MAKLNGTLVLLYADGEVFALQRGLDVNIEQDLPDVTNKESGGWAEHMNGLRNATVNCDALFSTTGKTGDDLIDYIIARSQVLMVITGGITFPLIGLVDISSVKLAAPMEAAKTVSGSFKVDGQIYQLKGDMVQMITDPDAGGTDYDTLTVSGTAITSAINLAGTAYCQSNTISVDNGASYKVAVFVTSNSGQLPTIGIYDNTSAFISNQEALVAGLNLVTLTATSTDASASLRVTNSAAANFALSSIYMFKV
jgi:predicted secreted protein